MSIKCITIHDVSDLKSVIDSPIFISCDNKQQNEETFINMWGLSIDSEGVKVISINNLVGFVSLLLKERTQQVLQLDISCAVVFYMWFDEMAAQLRFNIISGDNKKLPFGCKVEMLASPNLILKEFLASQYHDGISCNEFEELENDSEDDEEPFVLKVFVAQLNDRN